jgi:excisionase family DNA binding protein
MNEQFGERTFTTFEAARLCGVFHTTVINWANKGKLKARVTPGGHRRIPLSELVPFMKQYGMPVPADVDDSQRHMLVLDSEPATTRLIDKGFSKHKDRYAVRHSSNAVDALVQVGRKTPDVFVLDPASALMDGAQVCRMLKESAETRNMKILALSGRRLTAAQQEALAKCVDLILPKPFEAGDLVSAVERLLS